MEMSRKFVCGNVYVNVYDTICGRMHKQNEYENVYEDVCENA